MNTNAFSAPSILGRIERTGDAQDLPVRVKPMPLDEATQRGRETVDKMIADGSSPADDDIRMLDRLVTHGEAESDRTWANMYLLVLGALLLTLGAICGAAGCWHALHGNAVAPVTGAYAAGFMAFGWLALWGVRK